MNSLRGKTLAEHGISPRIQPEKGTMGALVHSIADYLTEEQGIHGHS